MLGATLAACAVVLIALCCAKVEPRPAYLIAQPIGQAGGLHEPMILSAKMGGTRVKSSIELLQSAQAGLPRLSVYNIGDGASKDGLATDFAFNPEEYDRELVRGPDGQLRLAVVRKGKPITMADFIKYSGLNQVSFVGEESSNIVTLDKKYKLPAGCTISHVDSRLFPASAGATQHVTHQIIVRCPVKNQFYAPMQ